VGISILYILLNSLSAVRRFANEDLLNRSIRPIQQLMLPLHNSHSWTIVKSGSADVPTGKRWMSMRRTSTFYPSYSAMPLDQ